MIQQEIHEILAATFPEAILGATLEGVHDPSVQVAPDHIVEVARFLRDDDRFQFDTLMCLSGMDFTGGKLGVVYHLHSIAKSHKLTLKIEVPVEDPRCQSVESVWKTANWHEREAYDLIGVVFDGHPDLRRILLPYDWDGHPLRKDYQVPEFYNGMKVPY